MIFCCSKLFPRLVLNSCIVVPKENIVSLHCLIDLLVCGVGWRLSNKNIDCGNFGLLFKHDNNKHRQNVRILFIYFFFLCVLHKFKFFYCYKTFFLSFCFAYLNAQSSINLLNYSIELKSIVTNNNCTQTS